ncbi:MAG: hypothetical protein Q8P20_04170 [bacterium]|nr:hypothetical protein [bacterium]
MKNFTIKKRFIIFLICILSVFTITDNVFAGTWVETQPAGDLDDKWYPIALSEDGLKALVGSLYGRLYLGSFDIVPPVITVPTSMIVSTPDPAGIVVTYTAPTAFDLVDGSLPVVCSSASGDIFSSWH